MTAKPTSPTPLRPSGVPMAVPPDDGRRRSDAAWLAWFHCPCPIGSVRLAHVAMVAAGEPQEGTLMDHGSYAR